MPLLETKTYGCENSKCKKCNNKKCDCGCKCDSSDS